MSEERFELEVKVLENKLKDALDKFINATGYHLEDLSWDTVQTFIEGEKIWTETENFQGKYVKIDD